MGYWLSYLGVGYGGSLRPLFSGGGVLLFSWPVVIAGLLVPALALTGFVWTRRWRYGPFFLAARARRAARDDRRLPGGDAAAPGDELHLQPRRGGAVPAHDLQGRAAGGARARLPGGRPPRRGCAAAARWALVAVPLRGSSSAAWPLATGRALDSQLLLERVPPAWSAAADHVDRTAPATTARRRASRPAVRLLRLGRDGRRDPAGAGRAPGGGALRGPVRRPARRSTCCGRSTGSCSSGGRCPASSARCSTCWAPGRWSRAPTTTAAAAAPCRPATAADVLDQLGPPDRAWGPVRPERRAAGTLGGRAAAPARARLGPAGGAPGGARRARHGGATVVDGGAEGIAGARGARRAARARRAPLRGRPRAGRAASGRARGRGRDHRLQPPARARGGADGAEPRRHAGRRRAVLARRRGARPVPGARDRRADGRGPRRRRGAARAVLAGVPAVPRAAAVRRVRRRPGDALAGRPRARRGASTGSRSRFDGPRDVDTVELLPYSDRLGARDRGRGRRPHVSTCTTAGTGSPLGLRDVRSLRVRIARVRHPDLREPNPGGLRELRIPGVRVREALRPPVLAERALAGSRPVAHRRSATCSSARRATTRSGATPRSRHRRAPGSCATAATASAGSSG